MADEHFEAGPSALARVLVCRASVIASRGLPDNESAAALTGTRRHRLLEICAKSRLYPDEFPTGDEWAEFTDEDREQVGDVLDYLRDFLGTFPGKLHVEVDVDLSMYWPGMKGRADLVIVADRTVVVIDAKFGRHPVPATSPQMKAYAVGIVELYRGIFEFDDVICAVAQPSADHYDEALYTPAELSEWAAGVMVPALAEAFGPAPTYTPDPDACKFCRAGGVCEPRKAAHFDEVVRMLDALPPDPRRLTAAEVGAVLDASVRYDKYVEAVRTHAELELTAGRPIPGHKLVESRTVRRYVETDKALPALCGALRAMRPELSEADALAAVSRRTPITLTAAEKLIGKSHAVFAAVTVKPAGKAALAPADDPRPEFHPLAHISASLDTVEI